MWGDELTMMIHAEVHNVVFCVISTERQPPSANVYWPAHPDPDLFPLDLFVIHHTGDHYELMVTDAWKDSMGYDI